MVTEKPKPTQACELVFLPDDRYVESFLAFNAHFHEKVHEMVPERAFNTDLVYHAAGMSVLENPAYQE